MDRSVRLWYAKPTTFRTTCITLITPPSPIYPVNSFEIWVFCISKNTPHLSCPKNRLSSKVSYKKVTPKIKHPTLPGLLIPKPHHPPTPCRLSVNITLSHTTDGTGTGSWSVGASPGTGLKMRPLAALVKQQFFPPGVGSLPRWGRYPKIYIPGKSNMEPETSPIWKRTKTSS